MNIYIIRHGETELNNNNILQGSDIDCSINKFGKKQSHKFFKKYKEYPFQKIYISQLKRTYQSIEPFISLGIPYEKIEGLNEISWGEKQGVKDDIIEYKQLINLWLNGDLNERFDNGESPLDVLRRLKIAIKKIIKDDFKDVLICTHGRALRIMLSWIINKDLTQMNKYKHSNLGLYILKYKNGAFRIIKKNERSHLV
tara:strand:- start:117 stop:710 length:594 start_codon:yes stop_codon:yes gene_type:complete